MFPERLPHWHPNRPTAREVALTPNRCRAWFGPSSGAVPLHSRPSATTEHHVWRTAGKVNGRMPPAGARAGDRDFLLVLSVLGGLRAQHEMQPQRHTCVEASWFVLREQVVKPLRELSAATQFRHFSSCYQSALPPFGQRLLNDVSADG